MRKDTDELIADLSRDAAPVKPLWPPYLRAGVFLAAVIGAMAAIAGFAGSIDETLSSFADMPSAVYEAIPEMIAWQKKVHGLKMSVSTAVLFDKAWIG